MKKILQMSLLLRTFLIVNLITLTALVTAANCDKSTNNNNNSNNNNSSDNSSGDNNSDNNNGNTDPTAPFITFTNFDANAAKLVDGTTIKIKASSFPTISASSDSSTGLRSLEAPVNSLKRIFDITITGLADGNVTGGLILVGTGNLASIGDFEELGGTNSFGVASPLDSDTEGVISSQSRVVSTIEPIHNVSGWLFFGAFMRPTVPTDAASAAVDASPFAFTGISSGGTFVQPFFFCRTVLNEIRNRLGGTGGATTTTTLSGGHIASCYIGGKGGAFTTAHATAWVGTAASNTFKKSFSMAIAGIRTDDKTIPNIGMPGSDDLAKVSAFTDNITKAEMLELSKANESAYKKVIVTMVSDADF